VFLMGGTVSRGWRNYAERLFVVGGSGEKTSTDEEKGQG